MYAIEVYQDNRWAAHYTDIPTIDRAIASWDALRDRLAVYQRDGARLQLYRLVRYQEDTLVEEIDHHPYDRAMSRPCGC